MNGRRPNPCAPLSSRPGLRSALASLAMLAVVAGQGFAETISFTGVVNSTYSSNTSAMPFGDGATFTGSIIYNPSTPLTTTFSGGIAYYQNPSLTIDLVVNGTYNYSQSYSLGIYPTTGDNYVELDTSGSSPDVDSFTGQVSSYGTITSTSDPVALTYFDLDGSAGFLSSTNLSTATLNASLMDLANSNVGYEIYNYDNQTSSYNSYAGFSGTFSSINVPLAVPEPSTVLLVAIAAPLATLYARKHRLPARVG